MQLSEIVDLFADVARAVFGDSVFEVTPNADSPGDIVLALGFTDETVDSAPLTWEVLVEALAAVGIYAIPTQALGTQPKAIAPNWLFYTAFTVSLTRPNNDNN